MTIVATDPSYLPQSEEYPCLFNGQVSLDRWNSWSNSRVTQRSPGLRSQQIESRVKILKRQDWGEEGGGMGDGRWEMGDGRWMREEG